MVDAAAAQQRVIEVDILGAGHAEEGADALGFEAFDEYIGALHGFLRVVGSADRVLIRSEVGVGVVGPAIGALAAQVADFELDIVDPQRRRGFGIAFV